MEYLKTDSLGKLVATVDTITALAKVPYAKRLKDRAKEYETWMKQQEKRRKRNEPYDSIYPAKPLMPNYDAPQAMDPNRSITIKMPSPLATLDTAAIHLYSKIDTLWYQAPFEFRQRDNDLCCYELLVDWHPDTEYSFEVDSAAFVDIYGLVSGPYKQGIKVKSLDEYGTLFLEMSGIKDSCAVVVQLLDKSDKVVAQSLMEADGTAQFYYLKPDIYYARAFVDSNGNGKWDTGDYDADLQAESVYYYPREIEAKAKWDITLQWQVNSTPRFKQKPAAIVKQKSNNKKRQLRNRNAERARQLGVEYIKNIKQ